MDRDGVMKGATIPSLARKGVPGRWRLTIRGQGGGGEGNKGGEGTNH